MVTNIHRKKQSAHQREELNRAKHNKLGMKVVIQYSNVRHAITSCCSFTCGLEKDKLSN